LDNVTRKFNVRAYPASRDFTDATLRLSRNDSYTGEG